MAVLHQYSRSGSGYREYLTGVPHPINGHLGTNFKALLRYVIYIPAPNMALSSRRGGLNTYCVESTYMYV